MKRLPANPSLIYQSTVTGNRWPGTLSNRSAQLLALQHQFEQNERLPGEVSRNRQFEQISLLLKHAVTTTPYYRALIDPAVLRLSPLQLSQHWAQIPVLSRTQLQAAGARINSEQVPADHGVIRSIRSSGSTGVPVSVRVTELVSLMWLAFTLREHLWHRRDLSSRLAAIRSDRGKTGERGIGAKSWGAATEMFVTGPAFILDPGHGLEVQLAWLNEVQPDYLLSFPSNLQALGERMREKGCSAPKLKELRTFGETLSPDLREILGDLWQVSVVDAYSAQEVGYLALQCPESPLYHAVSENILLEILDAQDRPCQPGAVGRVVVTALHNFASPLIRYEIGDWAEAGAHCGCGRTLPVINQIMGRTRNMVKLPDGSSHWPSFLSTDWADIGPVRQLQMVQTDTDKICLNLVAERRLKPVEQEKMSAVFRDSLGYPFEFLFNYVQDIPRSATGKYEDFICRI